MRGALVHVMPPSFPPERRRFGLRALLFGIVIGVGLLGATTFVALDAMSAVGPAPVESWRVLVQGAGKQELADAVPAGQEAELPLYACRVPLGSDMHVGRIRPDFAGCHIGFDGKETEVAPAETLAANWRAGTEVVAGALVAGTVRVVAADGSAATAPLYLCRAHAGAATHPGQIRAGQTECEYGYGGRRAGSGNYETLAAAAWMQWVPAAARALPDTAVVAGSEGQEAFFACRAADRAGLHPGKIKRNGPGCSIVSDGKEVIVDRFEILVARWIAGHAGTVPISAVPVGWEGAGLQYVCRARTRDSVQIGKVSDALGGCHVGMLGREVVLPDYEVLSQ